MGLPEAVWNADTKYLVFEKNKNKNKKKGDSVRNDEQKTEMTLKKDIDLDKSTGGVQITYDDIEEEEFNISTAEKNEGCVEQTSVVDEMMIEMMQMDANDTDPNNNDGAPIALTVPQGKTKMFQVASDES